MVDSTVPETPKKSLEDIKEEARKLAFPQDQQLAWNSSSDAAGAQGEPEPNPTAPHLKDTLPAGPTPPTNGHLESNGVEGLPPKPVGFSQTGELVGSGPASVNADPNNPALPPREVSKTIPCRFFPNCKYGNDCVFAHITDPTELAKSGQLQGANALPLSSGPQVGGFYYPGSHAPPYPYPPQDPHASQGGMPIPLEYANYMNPYAANGGAYYPPASPNGYAGRGAPFYPAGPYGYMVPPQQQGQQQEAASPQSQQPNGAPSSAKGAYPEQPYPAYSPPQSFPPHQNGLSQSPPSHSSPVDMYQVLSNGAPPNFTMTGNAPAFQPGQYSASPQQRAAQAEAVLAASGIHAVNGHRKRNSISLNSSNRRNSNNGSSYGPLASSVGRNRPYDNAVPLYIKKRAQTSCTFFSNNDCRNGDACEFAHVLPDGSDAKALKQNIIGLDGRVGDPQVIEEFRVHKEAKDREWKAGKRTKETSGGLEGRGRERSTHPNAHPAGPGNDGRQSSKASARLRQSHAQQRIPDGADFPALRSQSTQRSLSNSPEPSADADEKMSASIASLASESARSAPSFASAAARGAQVAHNPTPARKGGLNASQGKADYPPHSPVTTAQSLSPDLPAAPLLAEPIAAA